MSPDNPSDKFDQIVAQTRSNREERDKGYREKALKMYPWICGRCSREFSRENLQELTVHHRDHNHDNNPQDGSNWELLCLYCHDNEHSRHTDSEFTNATTDTQSSVTTHNPLAELAAMLKEKK